MSDLLAYELMPVDTSTHNLLKSLSVFGAAFLMRPVGGVLVAAPPPPSSLPAALSVDPSLPFSICPSPSFLLFPRCSLASLSQMG